jgi:DNA-binding XRE family transcriptional regulator
MKNALTKYLESSGTSHAELAKKLKITRAGVYYWSRGRGVPNVKTAIRLERVTKGAVSVYSWA